MTITGLSLLLLALVVLAIILTAMSLYGRKKEQAARESDRRNAKLLEARQGTEAGKRRLFEAAPPPTGEDLQKADEAKHRGAEGKSQLVETSARPTTEQAEETTREKARRIVRDEPLRGAEQRHPTEEPKAERPDPLKRGGRPRIPARDGEKQAPKKTRSRPLKPEIVCWKREREWILGVEIPDVLLENSTLEVTQNSLPLKQEESNEALWRLATVSGQVVVRWNEEGQGGVVEVSLKEECVVFKLNAQTQNQGRYIRSPSSGTYLVIAPDDWERDDILSGLPKWASEPVALPGYQAHFYSLSRNGHGKIAFRARLGENVAIESEASRFELVGTQLNDASEDAAPLYGGDPPRIRTSDERDWAKVGTIVVGEEGRGNRRWRAQLSPSHGGVEQEIPPLVDARRDGWYFLRFYDSNDDLLESLDFRLLSGVTGIRIFQQSSLPSEDGHTKVAVEIACKPDLSLQPSSGLAGKIQVERKNGNVVLWIPPDSDFDETRWHMGAEGGPYLEVSILVERLWWGISGESEPPLKWEDKALSVEREDFDATSGTALWIRLPRRRWVDRVFAGFAKSRARSFPVKVEERELTIPFREFSGSQELEDESQAHSLKLWVRDDDEITVGIVPSVLLIQLSETPGEVQAPVPAGQRWIGYGRYKTATAMVILCDGVGRITVNSRAVENYFKVTQSKGMDFLRRLLMMERVKELLAGKDAFIEVNGSSQTSARQVRAVAHALARALMRFDADLRPSLRRAGFGGVAVTRLERAREEM